MTGMETASMIPSIMSGSDIRDTPPWARMSAGTRSRAITATAPASSAIFACSAVTTSMITPPLSISAMPRLTAEVPVVAGPVESGPVEFGVESVAMPQAYGGAGPLRESGSGRSGALRGSLGVRLLPDHPHALDDGHERGRGERPQGDLEQDRQVEDVAEPGHHEDRHQPV